MLDCFCHHGCQVLIECSSASYKCGSIDCDRPTDVHWAFKIAVLSSWGDCASWCCCGVLSPGHAVVEVIKYKHCNANVAPSSVNKMVSSYPATPVTHNDDDLKFWIGELDSRGVRNRPAVQSMKCVCDEVFVRKSYAPDIRNDYDVFWVNLKLD